MKEYAPVSRKGIFRVGKNFNTMSMNPNSPLWSIYLWLLIHGGDPAPDEIFKSILTASVLVQVARTVRDPQVQAALRSEAFRMFEGSFKNEELAR